MNLETMSWDEVRDLLRKTDIVLIPIGSMEQHGPHLPLGTDTFIATEVAKKVSKEIDVALAPSIPYGCSIEHLSFSGTVTLAPETLMSIVRDVCESMIHHGFKKIVLVNGHGGNASVLETLIQSLKARHDVTLALVNLTDMVADYVQESGRPRSSTVRHAEALETSLLLAIAETKVKLNKVRSDELPMRNYPKTPFGVKAAWQTAEFSSNGVIGELKIIDRSEGERILKYIVENTINFLKKLE